MAQVMKVVLVGCGVISNNWFNAIKGDANVSIVGLVDKYEAAAENKKREHQLVNCKIGTDLGPMLGDVCPDLVFDCTVPEARSSVVETSLRAGCHVLSEKPMAASMEEARRLVQVAEDAKRLFAVMQNRRYDHRIRAVRNFIDSGAVGEITTLNGDFYLGPHFGGFRDKMPHVLLLDMAIHSFDQARLISGSDPTAVFCHEWNPRGSWYERDSSAVALFEMTNGIIYNYRGSWCSEGLNTSWESEWRVVGTRGTLKWDGADNIHAEVAINGDGLLRPLEEVPFVFPSASAENGHAACIIDFIDCVKTGRTPETVCTENIKSLAMVFGAIQSAQGQNRVQISV